MPQMMMQPKAVKRINNILTLNAIAAERYSVFLRVANDMNLNTFTEKL